MFYFNKNPRGKKTKGVLGGGKKRPRSEKYGTPPHAKEGVLQKRSVRKKGGAELRLVRRESSRGEKNKSKFVGGLKKEDGGKYSRKNMERKK